MQCYIASIQFKWQLEKYMLLDVICDTVTIQIFIESALVTTTSLKSFLSLTEKTMFIIW